MSPLRDIKRAIMLLRGQKVLLDEQLAGFYGVEISHLVQQVKRNLKRFPNDFMFQVTNEEWEFLKSQFVTSKRTGRGGRRTPPYAFTVRGWHKYCEAMRRCLSPVFVVKLIARVFSKGKVPDSEHPSSMKHYISSAVKDTQEVMFETIALAISNIATRRINSSRVISFSLSNTRTKSRLWVCSPLIYLPLNRVLQYTTQ